MLQQFASVILRRKALLRFCGVSFYFQLLDITCPGLGAVSYLVNA